MIYCTTLWAKKALEIKYDHFHRRQRQREIPLEKGAANNNKHHHFRNPCFSQMNPKQKLMLPH